MARVNGRVRSQIWLLQECKTKQLPVKVANRQVGSVCDQVPVRLLNPSPDCTVVYRGTNIATVEEIDDKPQQAVLSVQLDESGVSYTKRQTLSKILE